MTRVVASSTGSGRRRPRPTASAARQPVGDPQRPGRPGVAQLADREQLGAEPAHHQAPRSPRAEHRPVAPSGDRPGRVERSQTPRVAARPGRGTPSVPVPEHLDRRWCDGCLRGGGLDRLDQRWRGRCLALGLPRGHARGGHDDRDHQGGGEESRVSRHEVRSTPLRRCAAGLIHRHRPGRLVGCRPDGPCCWAASRSPASGWLASASTWVCSPAAPGCRSAWASTGRTGSSPTCRRVLSSRTRSPPRPVAAWRPAGR